MVIEVVAAAVVVDRRLLTVSKTAAPHVFYLPGGKPDPGESAEQTLARELAEELSTGPVDVRPYAVVQALAALEGVPMRMTVFRCGLLDHPVLAAELADLRWTTGAWLRPPDVLAPALRDVLLPRLRTDGLVDP